MRGVAVLLIGLLLCTPLVSACETEAANALIGKFPSPTGISPDKDDSLRETARLAGIGHETARHMLWRVLMGETFTELEIALEIDRSMEDNGSNAEWKSFDTIVASAENGAIPHGDPENNGAGPKIVEVGDVVVVDLGARVNDWVSDVTRTYIVGPTTNETIIEVYMAVYDAQNLTFPVIEAGTPAWLPDDIARTHIEDQGYGEYFIHSLGHGFGICVHEPPLLSSGTDDPLFGLSYNEQLLAVWDAVTVEPGIYLDGWFGVRIEDDFLVNQEGHEFLTADLPRDLDWFMIEKDDYEALEWHNENSEDEDAGGISEILPAPVNGIESIMLLTLVAAALGRSRDELSEIDLS
ncbi:MAG: M24 family metallopeptidase [Candidatus Poseidoniales archaeon]|jgi:methionine aminopeptidase|tara:strand:- start:31 stop:1083 length:1053 start_codon:yes stop_codon:yes gene_type:complete